MVISKMSGISEGKLLGLLINEIKNKNTKL